MSEIGLGPLGTPDDQSPAFLVRRSPRGDFVRAGQDGSEAALRWDMEVPEEIFDSFLISQPVGYDSVQVWWGVPPAGLAGWTSMCVVRSGFGHPSTPSDGEIVHYVQRPPPDSTESIPGTFFDGPAGPQRRPALPSGRWFYYTLFFNTGGKWIEAGTSESLVPVDYRHREHLLGLVPPFYLSREAEDSTSFITRWMTMIGYDLDYTRSLAEGVEKIYDPDSAPQVLIDAMGIQNLGFKKPSALGDIRYRSVLANNRAILFHRGTLSGLETYVEAVFKSEVYVNNGLNELLTIDDAEFYRGVGNWCPMPWRIGYQLAHVDRGVGPPVPPELAADVMKTRHVTIEPFTQRDDGRPDCPPVIPAGPTSPWPTPVSAARGIAKIQAPAGEHLAITCGAGQQDVIVGINSADKTTAYDRQHIDAFYRGIPVEEDEYYFSFWSRREPGNTAESDLVVYGFAQYSSEPPTQGFSDGFRGVGTSNFLNTFGGFKGWQGRVSNSPTATPKDLPFGYPLQFTRRVVRTGVDSDKWEHHVASFRVSPGCRYVIPFIWFHKDTKNVTTLHPDPINTPRYITGVMVNRSQSAGVEQVYRSDAYLKLLAQLDPTKHRIGTADEKIVGE